MFSKGNLTPKTVMAPAAAFTMACVLFAYTRSSIKEARRSARSTRETQSGPHRYGRHDEAAGDPATSIASGKRARSAWVASFFPRKESDCSSA
ncbi:uncharacterized protein B0I36DRAFT_433481 [Microdochium trichocladiopsis]|uniref:Uncharacterized protein n=1 Tax=Microdochium trichocladiopsis TaxID=1682393 RepID=A0A9P8Y1L6_9PEZI|nr:uncharacterized protein B0I36DRAFT_433481 [Microdochium trichocladiopsis]KAH7025904.1 hypothetical protein B0I36DRAFT_433481 [Microdochium trichocladiopsis]